MAPSYFIVLIVQVGVVDDERRKGDRREGEIEREEKERGDR